MAFNSNKFLSPLFKLFGKNLAGIPPNPTNLDIIQFNSTSGKWELASGVVGNAVQSSSNVGLGSGLALARVLDDLPFKSLIAGTGITFVVTATDIEIQASSISKFVLGYHSDKNWKILVRFGAPFTNKSDEAVEAEAQFIVGFAFTVKTINLFLTNNASPAIGTITLKRNSVAIPATTITIPALTTGSFVISGLSEAFLSTDEIHEEHLQNGGADNDLKNTSYSLECES